MEMKYVLRGLLTLLLTIQMGLVGAVEKITYYHNDALGSPVAATDQNGNLLWREAYRPYGSRLRGEDGGTNNVWYTGKQEDSGTGLSYFGARWYDPNIGRFMAIDPVDFYESNIHSFNRYAYANNNPYAFIDPDGNRPIGFNAGFSGVIDPTPNPYPGVKFSLSLMVAFDTESWEISVLQQGELGFGWSSEPIGPFSGFANGLVGTENTTIDDLQGLGASASASTSGSGNVGIGGAATLPSKATSSNEKAIFEGGVTIGTRGREAGVTVTYGKELKRSSIIRRTVDGVKNISNKAKNDIKEKSGDN